MGRIQINWKFHRTHVDSSSLCVLFLVTTPSQQLLLLLWFALWHLLRSVSYPCRIVFHFLIFEEKALLFINFITMLVSTAVFFKNSFFFLIMSVLLPHSIVLWWSGESLMYYYVRFYLHWFNTYLAMEKKSLTFIKKWYQYLSFNANSLQLRDIQIAPTKEQLLHTCLVA